MRPDWDNYFLEIAEVVAKRATCDRKHVGAVVVSPEHQILSTGYNGSPPGAPHCDDVGHELKEMGGRQSCVRTIHAEANAIAQAARNGVRLSGATLYTTASPCYDCGKLIANTGIKKIVFSEQYDSRYGMSGDVANFLYGCGVTIVSSTVDAPEQDLSIEDVKIVVKNVVDVERSRVIGLLGNMVNRSEFDDVPSKLVERFKQAVNIDEVEVSPFVMKVRDLADSIEKAVAAERERNVAAVRKIVDVVLAAQPEFGRDFVEAKFRELLHAEDVSINNIIKKALYAERNRAVEVCGALIDEIFQITPITSGDREKKHELLRRLYSELTGDESKQPAS